MNEGAIVLTYLPQADGRTKLRPALLLRTMLPFHDFLVCGISSQLHLGVNGFDTWLMPNDSNFQQTGLKQASIVRLGFLAVLPRNKIVGTIGNITPEQHCRLLQRLCQYLLQSV